MNNIIFFRLSFLPILCIFTGKVHPKLQQIRKNWHSSHCFKSNAKFWFKAKMPICLETVKTQKICQLSIMYKLSIRLKWKRMIKIMLIIVEIVLANKILMDFTPCLNKFSHKCMSLPTLWNNKVNLMIINPFSIRYNPSIFHLKISCLEILSS